MSAVVNDERPERAVASRRHTIGFLLAASLVAIGGAILSPISEWPRTLASEQGWFQLWAPEEVEQLYRDYHVQESGSTWREVNRWHIH